MRRENFIALRLSDSESLRLAALQAALGCNRSEALRVLLRGVDAEGQHGNRMLPNKKSGERAQVCETAGATPLSNPALTNP